METPSRQNEGPSPQNILDIMSGSFEGDRRNTDWKEKRSTFAILLQCYLMQQSEDENLKWITTYSGRFREIFDEMLPEDAGEMPQYPEKWIQCLEERLYEKPGWQDSMMSYEQLVCIKDVLRGVHAGYLQAIFSLAGMQMQVLLQILGIMSLEHILLRQKNSTPPTE